MPGPTTERLDEDFRSLRDDIHDVKVLLARMDERLANLETFQEDVKSNALSVATLDARVSWLVGVGKWLGSIFALAAVYGALNVSNRLDIIETQFKGVDNRLGGVEIQIKSVDGRLDAVETQIKSVEGRLGGVETQLKSIDIQLGELKGMLSRRQADSPADLDERIKRIARAIVDEAVKQAVSPKPAP